MISKSVCIADEDICACIYSLHICYYNCHFPVDDAVDPLGARQEFTFEPQPNISRKRKLNEVCSHVI